MAEHWAIDWSGRLTAALDVNTGAGGTISVTPDAPADAVGNRVRARIGTEVVTADVTTATSWTIVAREAEGSDRYPKSTWVAGTAVDLVLTPGQFAELVDGLVDLDNVAYKNEANTFTEAQTFAEPLGGNTFQTGVGPAIVVEPVNKNGLGIELRPHSGHSNHPLFRVMEIGTPANTTTQIIADGSVHVGTTSQLARLAIVPKAANQVGAVVRGFASQTANLQEWQDSTGTVLASVSAAGIFTLTNPTAANIPLKVKAAASQSANLTEWQDSAGTALSWVTPKGGYVVRPPANGDSWFEGRRPSDGAVLFKIHTNSVDGIQAITTDGNGLKMNLGGGKLCVEGTNGVECTKLGRTLSNAGWCNLNNPSATLPYWEFYGSTQTSGGAVMGVRTPNADVKPLWVRAAASQTANLQEWQSSTGTALASVDKDGMVTAERITLNTEIGVDVEPAFTFLNGGPPVVDTLSHSGDELTLELISALANLGLITTI